MSPREPAVIVERRGGAVWMTLNRPERLNALTQEMVDGLLDVFGAIADDSTARVVVLRGRGRGFCAGLDLKQQLSAEGAELPLPDLILAMRRCPQPIIALVSGPACGGGFAIALAADIRIAGESARMNDAFVNLGVSGCEMGVSYFLPRQVGLSVACELMYTGRFVDARRALAVGLVSEVVPDDALDQAGLDLVADMLRVAPLALRKTKETLNQALAMTNLAEVLELEMETQRECARGPAFEEGLRAFVERSDPRFADEVY